MRQHFMFRDYLGGRNIEDLNIALSISHNDEVVGSNVDGCNIGIGFQSGNVAGGSV